MIGLFVQGLWFFNGCKHPSRNVAHRLSLGLLLCKTKRSYNEPRRQGTSSACHAGEPRARPWSRCVQMQEGGYGWTVPASSLSPLPILFVLQPLEEIVPFLSVGSAFRLSFGFPGTWAEKDRGKQPQGLACPAPEPLAPFCFPFRPAKVRGAGARPGSCNEVDPGWGFLGDPRCPLSLARRGGAFAPPGWETSPAGSRDCCCNHCFQTGADCWVQKLHRWELDQLVSFAEVFIFDPHWLPETPES